MYGYMEWVFILDEGAELPFNLIIVLSIMRVSWALQMDIFYDYKLGESRTLH